MVNKRDGGEARRNRDLMRARFEFSEARSQRMLVAHAADADEIRQSTDDQAMKDRLASRSRTLLDAERMLQVELPEEVILGDVLDRYVTRAVLSSNLVTEMRSSIPCVIVGGEVCRWIMAITAELLHTMETMADPDRGCRAILTVRYQEGAGLILHVASLGGADRLVPSGSGSAAFSRVSRVMRLLGGLRQSVDGPDLVFEATFAGRPGPVAW